MDIIRIKKLNIENFRELKDLDINFGNKLTIISGRNGTGKSSILGLVSQFLSFRSIKNKHDINYRTLFNEEFESEFKNHLKISEKYDTPDKKYKINIHLDNDDKIYTLSTTKRSEQIRFVLRGNNDRNFTWPSIYLDLRRLTPMVYRKEDEGNDWILDSLDERLLIEWTNRVIPKIKKSDIISKNLPDKDIKSVVATGPDYDIKSASSGEDNIGQILMSLLSFKKLKDDYPHYQGGILLIDELDATLFPKSQLQLLDLLLTLAGKYKLQIIFTTHSPTMLNYIFEMKKKTEKDSKTSRDIAINYLTNTRDKIENMNYESVNDILDDLEFKTKSKSRNKTRKINVYCEDVEARDMLSKILPRDLKQVTGVQNKVTLGAENYISLIEAQITEFKRNSIIVLDGDKKYDYDNVLTLPFDLPPDQLVYKYLEDLPADSPYWNNKLNFDKTNFAAIKEVNSIRSYLKFEEGKYVFQDNAFKSKTIRTFFKEFYLNEEIQDLLKTANCNVFIRMKNENIEETKKFIDDFRKALNVVRKNIYVI